MNKSRLDQIQQKVEKRAQEREKKKKSLMKVSGRSVFRLKEIMKKKGKTK